MLFTQNFQILNIFFPLLVLWLSGLSLFLYRSISHYNRLVAGQEKRGLQEVLERLLKNVEVSKKEISNLKKKVNQLEKESFFHLQKIGLLKFNPFKDIGGEQSFVLALLDRKDSGVIITALHGRETTRWYVKRVKEGKGLNFELSKEEKETIKKASQV